MLLERVTKKVGEHFTELEVMRFAAQKVRAGVEQKNTRVNQENKKPIGINPTEKINMLNQQGVMAYD